MPEPQPAPRLFDHLRRLWQIAVEPAPSLKDPLKRQRARLLNSLMVIFMPLAIMILIVQMVILPSDNIGRSTTIKAITMGIALVALIYIFSRTGHYRFTTYFTLSVGFIAIITNAIASQPPHFEIVYLVMLPLLGTLLLSMRETLFLAIATIITLVTFDILFQHEIPPDIIKDLIIFITFINAFILFVSQHRNRLEADRQQLVVERNRNDLLNHLIRNLSHDFRTPLTIINTGVYLLRRTTDPKKQAGKLDQIEQQTARLTKLVDDILTISQLDHVAHQNLQAVDVHAMLTRIVTTFRADVEDKAVELQVDVNGELPQLVANQDNLERALMILIENAVRYTEHGHITVRAGQQHDALVIEVNDTGNGISEADLPHIFERFYRVDSARSSDTGETGLGLAIVKRVVELHHGQLDVDSIEGQGSTFRLSLPLKAAAH